MRKKWLKTMVSMITVFVLGLSFGLLAACTVTIPSSSESSAIDGGSNDGKSIVLDITSVKTFIGESVQLRAICKNVDESLLVWESSDDSVASVSQSGLVTALKKGVVKITVSAEGLSAVCSVNISESDAAPVLALSINEVDLRIGDSFSVVASTYYNGKLETVDYTWEFEDEKTSSEYISYTLNEDGSKVTFTALKEGSERLCVFANCKGIDLVEYLTVNAVDNDVYFTVDNFDGGKGGYFTELSLAKVENHLDSIIPEVEVFVAGEKQSNAQITWSNSNPAVAVMDEFGSISGLTVGVAVFTAKVEVNGKSSPLNLTVSVYAPELNYELSSAVEVDFNDTNSTFEVNLSELEQKLEGELVEVTIEGKPFGIKAHNGAILSLDKESVGGIYTEQEAVATFLRKRGEVTIAVEKVRMAVRGYRSISTVEQFNSMESYMQMEGTDAYADLRLVSDLDLKGAAMAGVGTYINTGSGWIANYYWKGVFDGQGHTIYNALESGTNSGLFCSISSGGIVRNVRFVNATLTGNAGIIATANDGGLVENVFVHGKISGLVGAAGIPPSLIVSKNYTGTIRECFAITDSHSLVDYGGMIAGSNTGSVINCVAINLSGKPLYAVGTTAVKGISKAGETGIAGVFGASYTDYSRYLEESKNYTYDDWALGIRDSIVNSNIGASLKVSTIPKNSSAQISIKNGRFVQSYESNNEFVTVSGGKISVSGSPELALGTPVIVTVNFVNGDSIDLSFTVTKGSIALPEQKRLNIDVRNENTTIDLNPYAENGDGGNQVVWAMFGSTKLTGLTISNGILNIPSTAIGQGKNDWGKISITVQTDTEAFEIPLFVYVSITKAMDLDTMITYSYQTGKEVYNAGQELYGYFLMTCDVDMYLYPFRSIGDGYYSGSYATWSRIFYGTFDGNGYALMNWNMRESYDAYVDTPTSVTDYQNRGLFACIGEGGVVKNVRFTNFTATNSGAVATVNQGTVENVFVEGVIDYGGVAGIPVGLLVGKNYATIRNCVVVCKGTTDPKGAYGAMLAGRTEGGSITNCVAINVSGKVIFGLGTLGQSVDKSSELADATNKIYHSWAAYESDKGNITIDDWAVDYITASKNS